MKKLLKVTAMTGSLTLVKMLMGFIIAKVVAIYTGPSGMAMLGQIQSVVTSLNGLVNAPTSNGIIKYTAEFSPKGTEACAPWWRAAVHWALVISILAIAITISFSTMLSGWLFDNTEYAWLLILCACSLPLVTLGTLLTSIINGKQQYRQYIKVGMFSTLVTAGVMVYMVIRYGIQGALVAAALQNAIVGIAMLALNFRQPWFNFNNFCGRVERKYLSGLGNYILMAVTTALTVPISFIFVRNEIIANTSWVDAGQWQAVWRISETYLSVLTIALGTYYLPKLATLTSRSEMQMEIINTLKVVIPFAILSAGAVFFFRDLVIKILFTDEFKGARDLFLVQLCGDVVKIISWVIAYPMLSNAKTKLYIFSEIFFSLTLVLFTQYFVRQLGVQGANYAYLTNYSLYLIVMMFMFVFSKNFLCKN